MWLVVAAVGLVGPHLAIGDVWAGDWTEKKRKIKYWYRDSEPQGFKDDVEAAATVWNDAGTGWTFTKGTESDHNVEVKLGQTGGANGQMWSTFPSGGPVSSARVVINKDGTTGPRQRTIEHEFGHCMRLKDVKDDTEDDGDIMEGAQGTNEDNLQPTANDLKEAKDAGATQEKKAETSPKSTTQQQSIDVTITPVAGVEFELDRAISVDVAPIDPATLFIDPESVSWVHDSDSVSVEMAPLAGAAHNEFYRVIVAYGDSEGAFFDGLLIVTAQPPPADQFPHAVVPQAVSAAIRQFITIDGSASFHDAPGAALTSYAWTLDDGTDGLQAGALGLFSFATEGDHEVTLVVEDDWGRTSEGTTIVHVSQPTIVIPTVSEWGVIVMALLLLTVATLIICRRQMGVGRQTGAAG